MSKQLLPPTYLLISLLAIVALGFLYSGAVVIASPWNLVGVISIVIGVLLNLAADKALHQANTTVKPFEEPTALITKGVYGISRHPMYLGFVLILLGVAVLMQGWTPYLVIPVFVALMEIKFVRFEEQAMQQEFGQAWLDYKRRVRRWI
jgi:protein-S-isoprenylcysteine O-methyltransferase Ste14